LVPRSANKATASSSRNKQTKEALQCYECEGLGHYARECPTRIMREITPTRQGDGIRLKVRNVHGPGAKRDSRQRVRIKGNLKTVAGREGRRQVFPP